MKTRRRTFTARQRLQIVLEGMQTDTTVADVCRRHEINSTMYYRWRDQLYENAERLFEKRGQGEERVTALEQGNRRLKEVIAEITTENLDRKRTPGPWGITRRSPGSFGR